MLLPQHIKDAATAAFRENDRLSRMSAEEREVAAQFYEQVAERTVGTRSELARRYNRERARFLRGQVDHIAPIAYLFGQAMTFRFKEGERVRLKEDRPALGLRAGEPGVIGALYALESPAYEVTFGGTDEQAFDLTLTEDDLLADTSSLAKFGIAEKQPEARTV